VRGVPVSPRRHLATVAPLAPTSSPPTFVIVAPADLERMIRDAVLRALADRDVKPANDPAVDWIDADEAARLLGCCRGYLRRVRGLPRHGSPRSPRYRRSEIEAFLRDRAGRPLNAE
jgi:hypothetical protein